MKKLNSIFAALATGAMMALAPVAAQAGTITVSGRINDGNGSAVLGATCTIEFASYDHLSFRYIHPRKAYYTK